MELVTGMFDVSYFLHVVCDGAALNSQISRKHLAQAFGERFDDARGGQARPLDIRSMTVCSRIRFGGGKRAAWESYLQISDTRFSTVPISRKRNSDKPVPSRTGFGT
jgi:hypothetical protein